MAVTAEVPEVVFRLAPLVRLDSGEDYWPMDPDGFIALSDLCWAAPEKERVTSREVDPERLGEKTSEPYSEEGFAAHSFTRPRDGSGSRAPGLPEAAGFFLRPDDLPATRGKSEDPVSAPVYYDHEAEDLRITYWFFYGGSTIPRGLFPFGLDRDEAFALEGVQTLPEPEAAAVLEEFRAAYPSLYVQTMEQLAAEPEAFGLGGRLERLLAVMRDAAKDPPLMHDGDWERVRVHLAEDGTTPQYVELFQHSDSERVKWPAGKERMEVLSASGTHASFAKARSGLDLADGDGARWETWGSLRRLRDAPWYGFGGAWGRVGRSSDGTGPLGPSRWK